MNLSNIRLDKVIGNDDFSFDDYKANYVQVNLDPDYVFFYIYTMKPDPVEI